MAPFVYFVCCTGSQLLALMLPSVVDPRQFTVHDFSKKLRFTVGNDWEMEKTIEVPRTFVT